MNNMIFLVCIILVESQDPLQVLGFNHLIVSCVTKPLGDQGITSVLGIDFFSKWDLFSVKHHCKCSFTRNPDAKLEGHD